MIKMKISQLSLDPATEMPIVILKDLEEEQAIPIWIGLVSATAIAADLEGIAIERPLTHDLFLRLSNSLGALIKQVEITELRGNTYYSALVFDRRETPPNEDQELRLECRASDALAIALRAECPILVHQDVITKAQTMRAFDPFGSFESLPRSENLLAQLSVESFGKWKM